MLQSASCSEEPSHASPPFFLTAGKQKNRIMKHLPVLGTETSRNLLIFPPPQFFEQAVLEACHMNMYNHHIADLLLQFCINSETMLS